MVLLRHKTYRNWRAFEKIVYLYLATNISSRLGSLAEKFVARNNRIPRYHCIWKFLQVLAGRMRPVGRSLPTPGLRKQIFLLTENLIDKKLYLQLRKKFL